MRSYNFPAPRGKYNVGYQYINLPDKKLEFAVYYPTKDLLTKKKDTKWMLLNNYWTRMHDTNMKDQLRPG